MDIECQAFDLFFANEIENISPSAKSDIPRDLAFKMFRGGGKFNSKSTSKLGFIAKLFILWKCLNKRWWIVVEDEARGMTPGQFMDMRKAYKKKEYGIDQAQVLLSSGSLILANKELSDTFSYLNRLSLSAPYNYLIKAKNRQVNGSEQWNKHMRYICSVFAWYEANKKGWTSNMKISIPEWLILVYLYHGREVQGSPIYKEFYKRAFQSSPTKIKRCFGVLQQKGYIQKTGTTKDAKLSITASGSDIVNEILTKYALNC